MRSKKKSFTMVELIVTIVVILILSSFVTINVIGAQEKTDNNQMISNANILANALNQYAMENGRKYYSPTGFGALNEDKYYGVMASSLAGTTLAERYIGNQNDVLSGDTEYVFKGDLTRAAVITGPKRVKGKSLSCNFPGTSYPEIIRKYLATAVTTQSSLSGQPGFEFYIGPNDDNMACYYVSL